MDRKQKKEFLIIAVGLLVLLSCMSFLLRSCSNQKAKQAQQRISTQQKIKQDKKEESTEKADTKKLAGILPASLFCRIDRFKTKRLFRAFEWLVIPRRTRRSCKRCLRRQDLQAHQ